MDLAFFAGSALLGVGLAMDAFSVSAANGLNDPGMPFRKRALIAGTFAFFQFLMPMIGWVCVHTVVTYFKSFEKLIPWIALILLLFLGIRMIREGLHHDDGEEEGVAGLTMGALILQGIATSIDALSVGFTIAEYSLVMALIASLIIAAVTLVICFGGIWIGRKFGTVLSGKASILGGCILIFIGLEIFISHMI